VGAQADSARPWPTRSGGVAPPGCPGRLLAEGIPYDTALVSLEIATLYAEQGRTAELKRLAAGMLPIFSSLHIHRGRRLPSPRRQ